MNNRSTQEYIKRILNLNHLVDDYIKEKDFYKKWNIANSFNTNILSLYNDFFKYNFFEEKNVLLDCFFCNLKFIICDIFKKELTIDDKRMRIINKNLIFKSKEEVIIFENLYSTLFDEENIKNLKDTSNFIESKDESVANERYLKRQKIAIEVFYRNYYIDIQ